MSENTREKIRQCNLGKKLSNETKEKISAKLRGRNRPDMAERLKNKNGESHPAFGSKRTDEHKQFLRELLENRRENGFTDGSKTILQFSKDGTFIREFLSSYEAVRVLNLKSNHISECCKSIRKTAHGYIWRYKEEI